MSLPPAIVVMQIKAHRSNRITTKRSMPGRIFVNDPCPPKQFETKTVCAKIIASITGKQPLGQRRLRFETQSSFDYSERSRPQPHVQNHAEPLGCCSAEAGDKSNPVCFGIGEAAAGDE